MTDETDKIKQRVYVLEYNQPTKKIRKSQPDFPIGMPHGPLDEHRTKSGFFGWSERSNSLRDKPIGFTHIGKPVPMPRPRLNPKGGVYSPVSWKSTGLFNLLEKLKNRDGGEHLPFKKNEWLSLSVTYRVMRPMDHFWKGKERSEANIKPLYVDCRPTGADIDNYIKFTLDCMVKAGVIEDDCSVCHVNAWKVWGTPRNDEESEESTVACLWKMKVPYKTIDIKVPRPIEEIEAEEATKLWIEYQADKARTELEKEIARRVKDEKEHIAALQKKKEDAYRREEDGDVIEID